MNLSMVAIRSPSGLIVDDRRSVATLLGYQRASGTDVWCELHHLGVAGGRYQVVRSLGLWLYSINHAKPKYGNMRKQEFHPLGGAAGRTLRITAAGFCGFARGVTRA